MFRRSKPEKLGNMEIIRFHDYDNCLRLSNGEVEIIISSGFGPRILAYNFAGGENVLGLHPDAKVETALGVFKPYGGHRFWIAPENMPNTYAPDNSRVEFEFDEKKNSLRLIQPIENVSGTQKEMTVALAGKGSGVFINHRITNLSDRKIELAPWALTIMRGGGEAFIPNEPFAPYGPETLLPIRNLTVWPYTDLSDRRWKFQNGFIRLKVDEAKTDSQKIGVLNKQGWIGYDLEDVRFIKRFEHCEKGVYPDMNSNTELYVAGNFIEIETLAPLSMLEPGQSVEHIERWELNEK